MSRSTRLPTSGTGSYKLIRKPGRSSSTLTILATFCLQRETRPCLFVHERRWSLLEWYLHVYVVFVIFGIVPRRR